MKNKGIKVAKRFVKLLMVLLIIVGLLSLGLSVYNMISYNVEASKYIYLLLGVFLLPLEFLLTGKMEGAFQGQTAISYCLIISASVLILIIAVLSFSGKMFNSKYSSAKRTMYGVFTNILLLAFSVVFVYCAIFFSTKYTQIENAVNNFGPDMVKTITTNFGFNIIAIKEIIVAYLGSLICLFAFVMFIIGISHKSTKVKIMASINFYSSEYEEVKTDAKTKEVTQNEGVVTEMPETNPKAKILINKIMQLEELKKAGKIDSVDYTRLRQKAIRRYKSK